MWDWVGNPEDRFSQNEAHILQAQSDEESPHGCYVPHTAKMAEDRHIVERLVYCFYAPNFEKVESILLSACPSMRLCVRVSVRSKIY